jgi:predicted metal-dependent hydrolase
MSNTTTPADLAIRPRDLKFNRGDAGTRWWLGGDPIGSAFFNALSVSFPQGEAFFIEAVRHYRATVQGPLQEQVALFIKQEVLHSREHVVFNRLLTAAGYDVTGMEQRLRENIEFARQQPPLAQLAITVALEHFTAIMARDLLEHPATLAVAAPEAQKLWRWHALEEIEHKSVAFDTYLAATAKLSGFTRWSIRVRTMFFVSLQFWWYNFQRMAGFFRQDGMNTVGTWLKVLRYLFLKPGILRRIIPAYLQFFAPGFHPWKHDERALLAATEQSLKQT